MDMPMPGAATLNIWAVSLGDFMPVAILDVLNIALNIMMNAIHGSSLQGYLSVYSRVQWLLLLS